MLAVLQFCEDDDMAFVLDRMFSRENPMRARLASGRVFVRFVVIEDQIQRRSICGALNQWLISSSDSASGIGAHFATSLELTNITENPRIEKARMDTGDSPTGADAITHSIAAPLNLNATQEQSGPLAAAQHLDSGAAANLHCPSPLPSGF
jgi:hypothetical protein